MILKREGVRLALKDIKQWTIISLILFKHLQKNRFQNNSAEEPFASNYHSVRVRSIYSTN